MSDESCPMGLICQMMAEMEKNGECPNYEFCDGLTEAWAVNPLIIYESIWINKAGEEESQSVTEVSFDSLAVPENYDNDGTGRWDGMTPAIERDLRSAGWDEAWGIPCQWKKINEINVLRVDLRRLRSEKQIEWLMSEGFMDAVLLPYTGISESKRGMIVTMDFPIFGWMEAIDIEDSKPY